MTNAKVQNTMRVFQDLLTDYQVDWQSVWWPSKDC